jgi:hypothetical protein
MPCVEVARVADQDGEFGRGQLDGLLASAERLIDQGEDAAASGNAVVQPGVRGAVSAITAIRSPRRVRSLTQPATEPT